MTKLDGEEYLANYFVNNKDSKALCTLNCCGYMRPNGRISAPSFEEILTVLNGPVFGQAGIDWGADIKF